MPHVPSGVADHRTYLGIFSVGHVNKKITLRMALADLHRKPLQQRQKIRGSTDSLDCFAVR